MRTTLKGRLYCTKHKSGTQDNTTRVVSALDFLFEVKQNEVLEKWACREKVSIKGLWDNRGNMIERLPKDVKWFKVRLEKEDLPTLRLIKDSSWNDLSYWTGDIRIAASNFDDFGLVPPRLPHAILPDGRTRQQYFDNLLRSLQEFRDGAGTIGHDLTLILVGCTEQGPFTILEGNHTVMALYFRYFVDSSSLHYPTQHAYVGISVNFPGYPWFHNE